MAEQKNLRNTLMNICCTVSEVDEIMASAAIRNIKSEALREAAGWKRQHNLGHSVWGDYLKKLAEDNYHAGGDDMITIWLNDRADRIERGE